MFFFGGGEGEELFTLPVRGRSFTSNTFLCTRIHGRGGGAYVQGAGLKRHAGGGACGGVGRGARWPPSHVGPVKMAAVMMG